MVWSCCSDEQCLSVSCSVQKWAFFHVSVLRRCSFPEFVNEYYGSFCIVSCLKVGLISCSLAREKHIFPQSSLHRVLFPFPSFCCSQSAACAPSLAALCSQLTGSAGIRECYEYRCGTRFHSSLDYPKKKLKAVLLPLMVLGLELGYYRLCYLNNSCASS